jgi:hypothetical protein
MLPKNVENTGKISFHPYVIAAFIAPILSKLATA